jgi:hypothetical protein
LDQNNAGKRERREDHQVHNASTPRELVPQDIYKPPRQQKPFGNPNAFEFFVHGEKGIRLSDALEGKWDGFEGRDNLCWFGDDRVQITLRLRVRLLVIFPAWDRNS